MTLNRDPHILNKLNFKKLSDFMREFRNLNKQFKCKPYPMTENNIYLLKLEGFKYDNSLYLNLGYYHIQLIEDTSI